MASAPPQILALGPGLGFMRALWAVDHELRSAGTRMRRRLGVTGPQRLVVRIVGRFPGCTAGEVATLLHVDPSTLTGVLARLTRRGLLRRRTDPEDRRRARFELTPRGRSLDRDQAGTVEAAVRRVLAGLAEPQLRTARLVLDTLARELAADASEPPAHTVRRRRGGGRGRG